MPTDVVVLGSTGSIGTQTLAVVTAAGAGAYRVRALSAGGSALPLLAEQAVTHRVPVLAVADSSPRVADRLAELVA
ncbi:1-deoxy-D-xylulose-5-phosphate reductoisomerase, partial [Georgenia sp. 10Sc9-8]|nr:1-deoxy-D-xylulose-5-phosphate reductoisomerase [Georgenia halotolerans]